MKKSSIEEGFYMQGRLLSLVRNIDKSNGLEALRQLVMNCQPKARNRIMSMLQGIMGYIQHST